MERAASARLSSGTYSASWFVARARCGWCFTCFCGRDPRGGPRSIARSASPGWRSSSRGGACRSVRAGCAARWRWGRSKRRGPITASARPPPDAGGHRERPRRGFVVAVPGGRRARARLGRRRGHPARLAVRPGRVHTCARQQARRAGGSRDGARGVGVGALRAAGVGVRAPARRRRRRHENRRAFRVRREGDQPPSHEARAGRVGIERKQNHTRYRRR